MSRRTLASAPCIGILLAVFTLLPGCGGSGGSSTGDLSDVTNSADEIADGSDASQDTDASADTGSASTDAGTIDITNAILIERSADCADYSNTYEASALDITNTVGFDADVQVSNDLDTCTFVSNSIPNHDFNDETAHFFNDVGELALEFTVYRDARLAMATTSLSQQTTNAILLNGVVVDILSAGCYDPSSPDAGADGNTDIGCSTDAAWLLDPLGTTHKFGADAHNAHVQPGGQYHYHGNPKALFDDNPGPNGSPVIGFAADGFPVYGSYFYDKNSGAVRKATSGYTLKSGSRTSIDGLNPGGEYDGTYVADWEYTGAGDLDECNGMTVDGQYGYYAIDSYPWLIGCFSGTPDESFEKQGFGGPPPP